jgi:hypothetical protein
MINSLDNCSNKETTGKQVYEIENDVEKAYSEGKLSELHYNLLNKTIQKIVTDSNSE